MMTNHMNKYSLLQNSNQPNKKVSISLIYANNYLKLMNSLSNFNKKKVAKKNVTKKKVTKKKKKRIVIVMLRKIK